VAVKFRDYYEVLGVPRNAKADKIKSAYRQLARKHHPDLKPQAERAAAEEKFKEINEAHEVLSDPKKRAKYDALGANWKDGMDYNPPPGAGRNGPGTVDFEDLDAFSDFFSAVFGGRGGARGGRGAGAGARVRMTMPGSDIEAEWPLTIEELLQGGKRRITVGGGRSLDVEVPAGARDGTVLRLAGQGGPGHNGGPPGDLYLHARLVPHARYRVNGDDLEMDLSLWPWQAVLGSEVRVETPDGAVKLKVPQGTQAGQRMRLKDRGLKHANGTRGDLYAVVRIVVPAKPGADERAAYEAAKAAATAPADRPAEE